MEKFFIITYLDIFLKIESRKSKAFQNEAMGKEPSQLTLKSKF